MNFAIITADNPINFEISEHCPGEQNEISEFTPINNILKKKSQIVCIYKNKRTTVGIGRSDFLKDHRDICIQVSKHIKVMVKIGMVAKKNKASRTEDKWAELSCDNVESVKALTNMLKA